MRGVLTKLGDRLLERLVPKTKATAFEDSGMREYGFVRCYCGDIGSPPPGSSYPCQWIEKLCDRNGVCSSCKYVGAWCCA